MSAVEARARNSRARGLGPKRNQYGDRSEVKLKWTQSDIIRLQELGFVLRQFLIYSSTLGFIYGFQIHGHDVADVVKNPPRVLR